MSDDNVFAFQTLEEQIEERILRNMVMSDGKERSYFDVMRNVDTKHTEFGNTILDRLIQEGVISKREATTFLHGRPQKLVYYRTNIPTLKDRVENL